MRRITFGVIGIISLLAIISITVLRSIAASHNESRAGTITPTVLCTADAKECPNGTYVGRKGSNCEFDCGSETFGDNSSDILITSPVEFAAVTSPLTITGEALSSWYYQASFSIDILDSDGHQIATGTTRATSNVVENTWVPFKSTLTFKVPSSSRPTLAQGILYLHKDNPSHLRSSAGFFKEAVYFAPVK